MNLFYPLSTDYKQRITKTFFIMNSYGIFQALTHCLFKFDSSPFLLPTATSQTLPFLSHFFYLCSFLLCFIYCDFFMCMGCIVQRNIQSVSILQCKYIREREMKESGEVGRERLTRMGRRQKSWRSIRTNSLQQEDEGGRLLSYNSFEIR